MTQKKSELPKILLAKAEEPTAAIYNSYHYLTEISALYSQAAQYEQDAEHRAKWQAICDSTLQDLGDVFVAWESTQKAGKNIKPATTSTKIYSLINRSCKQAIVIVENVNLWTPVERWARLLDLCERRWQRILIGLSELVPTVQSMVETARAASVDRQTQLHSLAAVIRDAAASIDSNFLSADNSPDDGSAEI